MPNFEVKSPLASAAGRSGGASLKRDLRLSGAVMLGLGSIVGTGVFVSIGVAAGIAGPNVLLAIFLASLVATCNGLSSAQLAAAHPVSGGTYEYGHRWLTPTMGFVAGWLFLCAKSASAATAALGIAGYLSSLWTTEPTEKASTILLALLSWQQMAIAWLGLLAMTTIVLIGIKRTSLANTLIVGVTLVTLGLFVVVGWGVASEGAARNLEGWLSFESEGVFNLFHATALMFVAYTGYGRIATMGEEVAEPRRTIPRAMILTLAATMTIYLLCGFVAIAAVGPLALAESTKQSTAPLLFAARAVGGSWLATALAVGAITGMLGVLLNLLLGLSRVVLAMSRRNDLPSCFARIDEQGVPWPATLLVTSIIAGLIAIGDVKLSWSFSALTVLVYYALTNLCAIRLSPDDRLFPAVFAWCGLISCIGLAFFIEPSVVVAGTAAVIVGLILRSLHQRFFPLPH